jgi:phage terminase large subunit
MSTSTIAQEVARRQSRDLGDLMTFSLSLADSIVAERIASRKITWPSPRYQNDIVGFFGEILGVEPWARQVELLEAVRTHPRVTVRSGHKVSKSHSAAGIALWFFSSFDDARVVMTSTTARQVDDILWRELRMVLHRSGVCAACKRRDNELFPDQPHLHTRAPCEHSAIIPEQPAEKARTGLRSDDFREVVGFTAKEAEAVAGVSGKNLLYIIDEASGVRQEIFEAIEGNRAGGARLVMFSNPTRNEGEHFDSFHSKKHLYKCITISSEETPNVVSGKRLIPGLAERDWVEEKKIEWGEDSALYKIRVKGEHALHEDGKIFSVHTIAEAEKRWAETPDIGRLYLGVDPAGEKGQGDESAFVPRRGLKAIKVVRMQGLNAEAHLVNILALLGELRIPRETPVVVVDGEGSVGAELVGKLTAFLSERRNRGQFELVVMKASSRAIRQGELYDRNRDALTGNLQAWFRDGGAIP